ncbi:hypothetical protein AVEN_183185-1, partial [Araneus ventricosus]
VGTNPRIRITAGLGSVDQIAKNESDPS